MDRRKLLEYGVRPKPNDPHLATCDGVYCERPDCEKGDIWREAHGKELVPHPEKGLMLRDKPKK